MQKQNCRKPYHKPQIVRVVLRKEQAVLSQCDGTATPNTGTGFCYAGACGKASVGPGDATNNS